ncbi:MAG: glycoside hydrolase family 9 protein [Candidatus Marinimicrobia bacterium]|nr:glycoside hydrolase family 9 protein [Candidatus Neomarinimicrobiota bacterium]MCF7850408.1 glycoside hydrolase family 9 protein [Candidatus Neomarinimicrobiota bacterium]MCF7904543.1 glycoside hydrolase family 9 protein [Candidatus Neomarinimicrobiota bacterium]
MRKILLAALILLSILGLVLSCNPGMQADSYPMNTIHVNQLGYLPDGYKSAVVIGSSNTFTIVSCESKAVVFRGDLSEPQYWEASGETVRLADFTEFNTPGIYRVNVGGGRSHRFEIDRQVFSELAAASVKAFYFHRAGVGLEEKYAGIYSRNPGHTDTAVGIHASAASESRPEGTIISSAKGWYDAGDYNKYIVNSAITVSSMMSAYEHYPEIAGGLDLNIPESGDQTPDLLDEIRWNLEWMLTMQDPNDGGVYHKLTSKNFSGMIMPEEDTSERWIVMKTTPAALDFAASMAQASRVYKPFDGAFSERCLTAAFGAWEWAQGNMDIHYSQPEDIHTGAYAQPGASFEDEKFWAATELMITTDETYDAVLPQPLKVPEWRDGAALAAMNLLHKQSDDGVKQTFFTLADSLLNEQQMSAYDVSNATFRWGSNSDFLNQAMILIAAYRFSGNEAYKDAAQSTFDWVMGKNPTGFSFVTGFGDKTPRHIHHRPSEADGIETPQPGWVAGGPNPWNQEDCGAEAYTSSYPALAYIDQLCSYATNEIAINWNGVLVYVSIALDAEG